MKIRRLEHNDIESVVELWYEASLVAHDFIPSDYWKKNKDAMASTYLPKSDTYLAVDNGKVTGFVAMVENYLAAIFVDNNLQGRGIGKRLLNFVKEGRSSIQLKVYKKNSKTVEFYKSQKFIIVSESKEEETGEDEYLMEWKRLE